VALNNRWGRELGSGLVLFGSHSFRLQLGPQNAVHAHLLDQGHLHLGLVADGAQEVLREYFVLLAIIVVRAPVPGVPLWLSPLLEVRLDRPLKLKPLLGSLTILKGHTS
jgi:hypothetical protein